MMVFAAVAGAAVALTASGCGSTSSPDSPGAPAAPASPGASPGAKPGDLTGTTWKLLTIESMAEKEEEPSTTIDDPSKFTVTFGDDGQAGFRINCNRGNSTWKVEGAGNDSGSLSFGPIAVTRMACPNPTQDAKVTAALGQVRSYLLDGDDNLHLSLEADSGIMHFRLTNPGG